MYAVESFDAVESFMRGRLGGDETACVLIVRQGRPLFLSNCQDPVRADTGVFPEQKSVPAARGSSSVPRASVRVCNGALSSIVSEPKNAVGGAPTVDRLVEVYSFDILCYVQAVDIFRRSNPFDICTGPFAQPIEIQGVARLRICIC